MSRLVRGVACVYGSAIRKCGRSASVGTDGAGGISCSGHREAENRLSASASCVLLQNVLIVVEKGCRCRVVALIGDAWCVDWLSCQFLDAFIRYFHQNFANLHTLCSF